MEAYNSHQEESCEKIFAALEESMWGYGVELAKIHLQTYPDDETIWLGFAEALTALHRFAEAEIAFEKALTYSDLCQHLLPEGPNASASWLIS